MGASALGQSTYTFEMRLIPDGATGAPTGLGTEYDIGDPSAVTATRIGFWLQARVAQTVNQNWGIGRFSRPSAAVGGTSFIQVTDSANAVSISRGTVNSGDTLYGRAVPYRNGAASSNNTSTGNSGPNNENGFLNSAGPGGTATSITGIDAYMGSYRTDPVNNPWGVNGGTGGTPWPSDGTFAPWANLYRVWIDITDFTAREITIEAGGLVNGLVQTQNIGAGIWPMQVAVPEGQVIDSNYSFETASFRFRFIPTPSAAALLGLGGLAAARRRR